MGGFTPIHVPNCIGWIRSDLGLPGGITSGSLMTSWGSQYGSFAGCAQTTDARKPTWSTSGGLNSRPRIIFDGARAFTLDFDVTGAKTLFLVYKLSSTASSFTLVSIKHVATTTFSDFSVNLTVGAPYLSTSFISDHTAGTLTGFSPTLGTTNGHYEINTYNGGAISTPGSYTDALDGTAQTLSASGATGRVTTDLGSIGARMSAAQVLVNPFIGDFYELAVYSNVVATNYQNLLIKYSKQLYLL